MQLPFTKMHGLGNDFMVLDCTRTNNPLSPARIRQLADRHRGVGFDQLLELQPATSPDADFSYRIVNADGSEAEQCGNGARCLAHYIFAKGLSTHNPLRVQTVNRMLQLTRQADGQVTVALGVPDFDLARVPLRGSKPRSAAEATRPEQQAPGSRSAQPNDTRPGQQAPGSISAQPNDTRPGQQAPGFIPVQQRTLSLAGQPQLVEFYAVSMGNPHAVLVVDDLDQTPVAVIGAALGQHPDFTAGVNVGFMQVHNRHAISLRVVERNAGETLACGTGAGAAVAVGVHLGLLGAAQPTRTGAGSGAGKPRETGHKHQQPTRTGAGSDAATADQGNSAAITDHPPITVHTRGGKLTINYCPGQPVMMTGPAETVYEGFIEL